MTNGLAHEGPNDCANDGTDQLTAFAILRRAVHCLDLDSQPSIISMQFSVMWENMKDGYGRRYYSCVQRCKIFAVCH
jgi:hypothetical protein